MKVVLYVNCRQQIKSMKRSRRVHTYNTCLVRLTCHHNHYRSRSTNWRRYISRCYSETCRRCTLTPLYTRRRTTDISSTLCFKKCTELETAQLGILSINVDEIWQKYSKYFRLEFARFSFHAGLLFVNLSSFKPEPENISAECH